MKKKKTIVSIDMPGGWKLVKLSQALVHDILSKAEEERRKKQEMKAKSIGVKLKKAGNIWLKKFKEVLRKNRLKYKVECRKKRKKELKEFKYLLKLFRKIGKIYEKIEKFRLRKIERKEAGILEEDELAHVLDSLYYTCECMRGYMLKKKEGIGDA
jgi:hypothetical protein